jgi:prepilin-type processing-associated H-X9-DG protein
VLFAGLFVMIVIALILLPSVGAPREAGRRTQCCTNLRQIGLAMQKYQQKYGCFPPAFIPDDNGKPKHSWRVLILPFLGQDGLYAQYRFDEPWNGPHNKELATQMPAVYRCPTYANDQGDEAATSLTSYAMIVGPRAISDGPTSRKAGDVQNESQTIMVAECAGAGIRWLEPRDLNAVEINCVIGCGRHKEPPVGINSYHPGMANVLFCDGVVVGLRGDCVDEKVLKAILTIDGDETVNTNKFR